MKLYDAMTPNSFRVNVFLAEKGRDVAREPIDVLGGATRQPDFLAKNSLGGLPLLELDDGRMLAESVAICRYFEELHPEPKLFGDGPFEVAHVEMWNRRMELCLFNSIGDTARHSFEFFADKLEQVPDYAAASRRQFDQHWRWLDKELSDGRPFVAGESFTVADITGAAALLICRFAQHEPPAECQHAQQWQERVFSRASVIGALPKPQ